MIDIKRERVKFTISRKLYLPIYLMIIILIGLIGYIKFLGLPLSSLTIIGTAIFAILGIGLTELHRLKDSYHITPDHVEHRHGYIGRSITKILIKSITDIHSKQRAWERIIGYGSIRVQSQSGANHIEVKNINNPSKFISILEEKMEEMERKITE